MSKLATPQDVSEIMTALLGLLAKSPAPQMQYACPMEAELAVRHAIHEGRAVIFDGYFIMYELGRDWYMRQGVKVLIEQIILKFRPTTVPVEFAVAHLGVLATSQGASLVATGDTQVGYMAKKYEAAGYTTLGTQFIKEIPNGMDAQGNRGARSD